LAVLALPPLHLIPALIPAFSGLIWLLESERGRRGGALTGFLFGLGFFSAGLYWVANALLTRPEELGWLAPFAVVGLAAVLAPFVALAAYVTCAVSARRACFVIVFAAAWMLAEWLRSWLFTGFPWNLIATVWTINPEVLQAAALVGPYGLSFVTVMAAGMFAVLAPDGQNPTGRPWLAVLLASSALGLAWAYGTVRLANADLTQDVPGVSLRLVQPNIPQGVKWKRELLDENLLRQAAMGSHPGGTAPTHVIWSEVAAPMFLLEDPDRLALISRHTPDSGFTILGTLRRSPPDEPFRLWNSLAVIDTNGNVVQVYDKSHLVPFGEYIPFRRIIDVANLTIGYADFTPGPGIITMRLPGLPGFSPLICYEVIFPAAVADARDRPLWLLNLTNDGWYGHSSGPYQHLAAAQMRAVEEGLPLVRVANTGISAVIDPHGRVLHYLGLGITGTIDGPLPQALAQATPYAKFGNSPILAIIVFAIIAGALLRQRQ
jgi:apolipoprotein N-acyltransferase